MEDNYLHLIGKIDSFIRKYYKNRLLKGVIYALATLVTYSLLAIGLEYFSWFGTAMRTALFYAFLAGSVSIVAYFIIIPLLKMARLGKIISYEQAAKIIGQHFSGVNDVLINTLQLHQTAQINDAQSDLILAGIDQKIKQLRPFNFPEAIDLGKNRKYLPYALIPLLILISGLLISPSLIISPTKRIIKHDVVFERPAPFRVTLLNTSLKAIQQDDFVVRVLLSGNEIPEQLFIKSGAANYRMIKKSNVQYEFTFRNLQQNTSFVINTDSYNSKEYLISILPKPVILSFTVQADYPAYLNHKPESFTNTGDITVPAGTLLTWKFFTRDTKSVIFSSEGKHINLSSGSSNAFTHSKRIYNGLQYSILPSNDYFGQHDSIAYQINVIPDLYPSIEVAEYQDTIYDNRLYFQGKIKDDYGFGKLNFVWNVKRYGSEMSNSQDQTKELSIDRTLLQQQFYHFIDMATLFVQPGDEVKYYFEVWDNDGVVGSKASRSSLHIFKVPTPEEIEKRAEQKSENVKDNLESLIKQSKSLQKQASELQKKMVDKKELDWQDQQALQQMMDKNDQIQNKVSELEKENKEKNTLENQYNELSPEIIEKQRQLEDLFNKINNEELKKLFDEMKEMLQKLDKDKVSDMLEKIKNDTKSIEKELDRNLELFKQLELEQKLQNTIDKLDKLSEDQQKLSDKTKNDNSQNAEQNKEQQSKINDKFKEVKDDIDELKKLNNELEEPNSLKDTETEENDVEKDLEQASDELSKGNSQKASGSQKSAGNKMKNLSQKLTEMQQEMESEAEGEDMEQIRQILDNLVKISFNQEDLMKQADVISPSNPKYLNLIQNQKNLKDDLKMVSDSLFAVSKRQESIKPFVLREISNVENNMDEAITLLNNRSVNPAKSKQQYAMTSVNNLALMLSESLKQMQQNMQNKGSGKGNAKCNKPGGQGGKMKSMRQLQEQLNNQLKQMKDGMGQTSKQGQKQMSEKFARMAAQQEALRKQLQDYGEEMQKQGTGMDKSIKQMMQQMEQTETDLVNKRISQETLKRQQEITTRMLESEKAEQKREYEEKRESEEGKDLFYNNPAKFFEYNKKKSSDSEMLKTIPPGLKPFYKSKVNAYFLSF